MTNSNKTYERSGFHANNRRLLHHATLLDYSIEILPLKAETVLEAFPEDL
jgi:hypothetical protein